MTPNEWAKKERFSADDLVEIVRILRGENGCPWDRVQTHATLRNNLLEEAYETAEGIDLDSPEIMREELGDLLLQIVFHCGIAEDNGEFTLCDVTSGVCRKMIRRHPHIFGDRKSVSDLQKNWDEIKKKEKGNRTLSDVLSSVAASLPALMRAEKFIEKRRREKAEEAPKIPDLSKKEAFGEKMYLLCRKGMENGLSPEECLQAYLKKNGEIAQTEGR